MARETGTIRFSRRRMLQMAAWTSAGLVMAGKWTFDAPAAYAFYQSPAGLQKFIQPLRGVGPGGIPVAIPDGYPTPVTGAIHYSLNISQYTDILHPMLGPTTLWGYSPAVALGEGSYPQRHLGGIIVAEKGEPIQLTFTNKLPKQHILPVDTTIMGVAGQPNNRTAVHLHGGFVPWISDGGPFHSFDTDGDYGESVSDNDDGDIYKLLNPELQPDQAEYYYPNAQSARMMWYHDHAVGITRLNAYAGIASAYIIRDSFERSLQAKGLPAFVEQGGREIPIVIQDKIFVGANILAVDPKWPGPTTPGSLWYPHVYEKKRWNYNGSTSQPETSVIPEMFGDTMLANGTVYPVATVEARRYRLRILNACQARFLNLQLYVDDGSKDGIRLSNTLTPVNPKGPDFLVLGTEGGFLSYPVSVPSNVPFNAVTMGGSLITAPAERWDVLVDFSGFAGKRIIMYNDAPAPFPMGAPINDYFPGAPNNPTQTKPGFGPNTRQIMAFNVVAAQGAADPPLAITTGTKLATDPAAEIDTSLVGMWTTAPLPPPPADVDGHPVTVRQLTLNEAFDAAGRLIQYLGTNVATAPGAFGRTYDSTPTETPAAGATEVWQIANLTGDTHPIHFHLVNVQILSRQPFDVKRYAGTPIYIGPVRGPDPTELGWKETVRMHPGEVTTVIMRFDLPPNPPNVTMPVSPRTGGYEYVWHCHILEHEEHDMMRPLIVMP